MSQTVSVNYGETKNWDCIIEQIVNWECTLEGYHFLDDYDYAHFVITDGAGNERVHKSRAYSTNSYSGSFDITSDDIGDGTGTIEVYGDKDSNCDGSGSITFVTTIAPTVTTLDATSITTSSATIGGNISDTGNENPVRKIYWGITDEGEIASNWDNVIDLDTGGTGDFISEITSLSANQTYYFKAYAENSVGGSWGSTKSFTTNIAVPSITTGTVSNITTTSADVSGDVTGAGGENPVVKIYYGTSDGGTTASNWDNVIDLGTKSFGSFTETLDNLINSTDYYYNMYVENSAGGSWGTSNNFTTINLSPDITFSSTIYPDIIFTLGDYPGNVESAEVQWQAADEGSYTTKQTYTSAECDSAITYTIPYADLEPGDNTLKVIATDNDGESSESILTFTLENIRIVTDSEIPTGNIELGIIDLSAIADTAPRVNGVEVTRENTFFLQSTFSQLMEYDYSYRLNITIADNASYTDADTYTTEYVASGERVGVQHGISATGTYYIKIEAELWNGDTTGPLEYSVMAYQILYFIDEPSIDVNAPIANKVTVVSDTASYIATTDPAPASDEVIHKRVEIDEGDASVCQEVAEELINRWSVEQKTVSGNIDLTVTLKFKERVRVIVPNNEIDEFMPVQKKTHRVTEGITEVICGDIQLSESELLARILDEMEG